MKKPNPVSKYMNRINRSVVMDSRKKLHRDLMNPEDQAEIDEAMAALEEGDTSLLDELFDDEDYHGY